MRSVAIIGTRGYPSFYGGFETLVRNLAPALADDGWQVSVYGRGGATNPSDPSLDARIISVMTPGVESKSMSTASYGFTSSLHSARVRPDVALVMNVANGLWLPMLKARNIPTVVNVDGIEWEREKWGRVARSVFLAGARMTARFADRLVFDSVEIGKVWSRDFARDGDFIPYGGATSDPVAPVLGLARRSYVLMVARFVPENTVEQFFGAAELLARTRDVVIVGSTGYGGELDKRAELLAEQSERVRWLGHVSDDSMLFSLWGNAGAYFHGHSVGGTNPALVQAMACGSPIVARDTVYNREVLGEAGVFVQPDVESIYQGLERVLADDALKETLSLAASERQRTSYTWAGVCSAYHRLLDEATRA